MGLEMRVEYRKGCGLGGNGPWDGVFGGDGRSEAKVVAGESIPCDGGSDWDGRSEPGVVLGGHGRR